MAAKKSGAQEEPATRKSSDVRANIQRTVVNQDGALEIYANDTQVVVTPWDICLGFGVVVEGPTAERQSVVIKKLADVRISPQHAKVIAFVLQRQLANYEKNIGPIPIPSDFSTGP